MQEELSLNEASARWAVESWAYALGIVGLDDVPVQTVKSANTGPSDTHIHTIKPTDQPDVVEQPKPFSNTSK